MRPVSRKKGRKCNLRPMTNVVAVEENKRLHGHTSAYKNGTSIFDANEKVCYRLK